MTHSIQEAYPVRQKGIHFVNPSSIFDAVFKIFYNFMSSKIKKRVSLVTPNGGTNQNLILFVKFRFLFMTHSSRCTNISIKTFYLPSMVAMVVRFKVLPMHGKRSWWQNVNGLLKMVNTKRTKVNGWWNRKRMRNFSVLWDLSVNWKLTKFWLIWINVGLSTCNLCSATYFCEKFYFSEVTTGQKNTTPSESREL